MGMRHPLEKNPRNVIISSFTENRIAPWYRLAMLTFTGQWEVNWIQLREILVAALPLFTGCA